MASDPVNRVSLVLLQRPVLAAALGLLVLVGLLYSVLVAQELFVAVWFVVLVFFAYLAWRFVQAFELVARAVDRYVDEQRDE